MILPGAALKRGGGTPATSTDVEKAFVRDLQSAKTVLRAEARPSPSDGSPSKWLTNFVGKQSGKGNVDPPLTSFSPQFGRGQKSQIGDRTCPNLSKPM